MSDFQLRPPQIVTPEGETVDNTERAPLVPRYEALGVTLFHGDCLDVLRELPDESVHAVVTDPPYGIGFMGKAWDHQAIREAHERDKASRKSLGPESDSRPGRAAPRSSSAFGDAAIIAGPVTGGLPFQEWCTLWARECLRILKPGGHLLSFGGSRTWHRLAAGVEDAGFEMRDSIAWLYGSGFPKSLDVAKAIDATVLHGGSSSRKLREAEQAGDGETYTMTGKNNGIMGETVTVERKTWQPETDEAKAWDGWGTALKPSFEPIVVARKPIIGTVAKTVLAYGTGAINIDATRVHTLGSEGQAYTVKRLKPGATLNREGGNWRPDDDDAETFEGRTKDGRHTPNVVLDESQATALDEQTGVLTSGLMKARTERQPRAGGTIYGADQRNIVAGDTYGDSGGASRFFPTFRYEAKAPQSERPVVDGVAHPTVKPLELMQWLVRLVTPKGGTVLEPFAGSGTTVEACLREGFDVIAIEREADYLPLIEKRIRKDHAQGLDFDWGEAS